MKKCLSLIFSIFMIFVLCACGSTLLASQEDNQSSAQSDETASAFEKQESKEAKSVKYDSYQAILDDYTVKLTDATPVLIEEYNSEAADNDEGLEGLAGICNSKVTELAKISNDGISEMAKYYYKHGNGSYDEYSEWAGKLQDVYIEEAGKIQEAYMQSAMG